MECIQDGGFWGLPSLALMVIDPVIIAQLGYTCHEIQSLGPLRSELSSIAQLDRRRRESNGM